MQIKLLITNRLAIISLLILMSSWAIFVFLAVQPVGATHTAPHCREVYGTQVPQSVIDSCIEQVEQSCANQFPPGQTLDPTAYTTCVNGAPPTSGQEDGTSAGSPLTEFTPIPDPLVCDDAGEGKCCNGVKLSVGVECTDAENPILGWLGGIINFLLGGVLLVVTAVIIYGGIQYITAGGVPQRIEAARKRIINAVIALLTFLFLYGILQWLIPGGVI